MSSWMESVEISERKKARERKKKLEEWDAVSEISLQLQSKYNADGLFRFNFRAMSDADVLDWCKCAICWTDVITIERLLHIEGGKIIGYENGEFYILKSDNHGNLYHIKTRAEAESFIKMFEEA